MEYIKVGLTAEKSVTVREDLTASSMGSGGLDVYATPAMIALMEAAAVAALDPNLTEGKASVGIEINIEHLAATPVGEQVRARAEITAIEGKRVFFSIQAWDEKEIIGSGTHVRYVIDVERFMSRVNDKGGK